MKTRSTLAMTALACVVSLMVGSRQAAASISLTFGDATEFDSSTLPNLLGGIYPVGGTGISNGEFSLATNSSGLQVGLRAKKRFFGFLPSDSVPGDATYVSAPGESPTSGTNPTPATGIAKWNFEFHLDQRGLTGTDLADSLILSVDVDPGAGIDIRSVDLIALTMTALSINNIVGGDPLLLQSSQNLGFGLFGAFDPFAAGDYDFTLEAYNVSTSTLLAATSMTLTVTPEPIALFTWSGLALCGVIAFRRRITR